MRTTVCLIWCILHCFGPWLQSSSSSLYSLLLFLSSSLSLSLFPSLFLFPFLFSAPRREVACRSLWQCCPEAETDDAWGEEDDCWVPFDAGVQGKLKSIEFARYDHANPVALPLSLVQVGILFSLGPVVGSGNLGSAAASVVAAEQGFIVLCHVDLRRRRKQG